MTAPGPLIIGLFLGIGSFSLHAAESTLRFAGTAYNDNGDQIYTEKHRIKGSCQNGLFSPELHQVTYFGSDDQQIASKQMIIGQSPLRPSFQMQQSDFNEVISVTNKDDKTVAIEWHDPEGETHNDSLDITDDMVFDSGFVHLIRQNWQALNNGEDISFQFLSPTRADTYSFVASPASDNRIDAYLTIRMAPASTVLGWLVDPINLGFDKQGRLTDYYGLTNIRKNDDDNYTASIHYGVAKLPCPLIKRAE